MILRLRHKKALVNPLAALRQRIEKALAERQVVTEVDVTKVPDNICEQLATEYRTKGFLVLFVSSRKKTYMTFSSEPPRPAA